MRIIRPVKLHQKSTWKRRVFFDHRNFIEKVRGKDAEIRRNLVSAYRCNIDVEPKSIRRDVSVGIYI